LVKITQHIYIHCRHAITDLKTCKPKVTTDLAVLTTASITSKDATTVTDFQLLLSYCSQCCWNCN